MEHLFLRVKIKFEFAKMAREFRAKLDTHPGFCCWFSVLVFKRYVIPVDDIAPP